MNQSMCQNARRTLLHEQDLFLLEGRLFLLEGHQLLISRARSGWPRGRALTCPTSSTCLIFVFTNSISMRIWPLKMLLLLINKAKRSHGQLVAPDHNAPKLHFRHLS